MKCIILLCLLVATASAAPGLLGSIRESVAGSSSKAHSLGGDLNFGPLKFGTNLNSAQSASYSKATNVDSGYGTSGSHAEANAASQSHSLGGGLGLGPFSLGGNLHSSNAEAQASSNVFNGRYRRQIYSPFGLGQTPGSSSSAQSQAQASSSTVNNNYPQTGSYPQSQWLG